jgi:hypothetical protein
VSLKSDLQSFQNAVVDGFEAACARVISVERAFAKIDFLPVLYLLLDHSLLLTPSHLYLTISAWSGDRLLRTFSSLSPQDRAYLNLRDTAASVLLENALARARWDDKDVLISFHRIPEDLKGLQASQDEFFKHGVQRLLDAAGKCVLEALESLRADYPLGPKEHASAVIPDEVWHRQIDIMRYRMDPIITTWSKRRIFPRDERGFARLFVGFRQPLTSRHWSTKKATRDVRRTAAHETARYGYTTRIFLTPTQQRERGLTEADLEALNSLGQGERAIADTPLTTGIIDIGFAGERDPNNPNCREHYLGRDGSEQLKVLEDRIYGTGSRSESVFYIPIHIGGIAWLALFTFLPEATGKDAASGLKVMWKRYRIYRDVAPTMGGELSQAFGQAFSAALAEEARLHFDVLRDKGLFADRVTTSWTDLSEVFPYGTARLSVEPDAPGSYPVELRVSDHTHRFYLSVQNEPEVSHRLLDLDSTAPLLQLRLQAGIEARAQERSTLIGLTVHEWVSKLSDGIVRSQKLKEAAIEADVGDALLDHICALHGTLQSDIGLPWILHQSDDNYFTRRPPDEHDISFLRHLFEFHVRAIVGARTDFKSKVRFVFQCPAFPASNCAIDLPANVTGISAVSRSLDDLLIFRPLPWPLHERTEDNATTREGLFSSLTLVPRELLRNALRHGGPARTGNVTHFEAVVRPREGGWQIEGCVRNALGAGAVIEKRMTDIRLRSAQLQNAVPFVRCEPEYLVSSDELSVRYSLSVRQHNEELSDSKS